MDYTQKMIGDFDALRGTRGYHMDLARQVEQKGLVVVADPDNNGRSIVKLPGVWNADGSDVDIGEIIGDANAVIR